MQRRRKSPIAISHGSGTGMVPKLPPLTIPELQSFVEVAKSLNFRVAAERSYISQPALSRRIQSAEFKLNLRLFDRSTRRVELTSAGKELLPIAERMLDEFNESLAEVSEYISGGWGHVTIASLPSFAAIMLPPAMVEFHRLRPNVTVALKPVDATTILGLVTSGVADFGITVPPPATGMLDYESIILSDELVVICSEDDPLSKRDAVEWTAFAERPYITSGADSSITPVVERALRANGVFARPQFEAANISVLGALVAAGLGIAAMPRRSLHLVDTRRLRVIPISGAPFSREAGILRLKGRTLSLAAQGFLDILMQRMAAWAADA
jgi:LysR family carnitine catabolism transcriptional activator